MQDNYGNKHTFRIRNTHCFCTATMVMRTRLYVTLYVHCLSYLYNAIRKNKMLVLYSGKVIKRKNGSADSTVNLVKLAHVWTWNKKLIFTFTGATWRILIGCQWNGKGLTYCTTVWHTVLLSDILYYCLTYCTTAWHTVLLPDILYYCLTYCTTVWHTVLLSDILYYCLTYCTTVWHTVLLFDILYYCLTYCTTVWHTVLLSDILYYCLTYCTTVWHSVLLFYILYYCFT